MACLSQPYLLDLPKIAGMTLSIMLAYVYDNKLRVVVHNQPTWRHYLQHGSVLFGVTHGDKTRYRNLPGIMATECPVEWGQTRHQVFYRGHEHRDERQEFNGCVVEKICTIKTHGAHEAMHGYLAGRDMKLVVMHAEYGEVARNTCSIELLRDMRGC